MYMVTDSDVRVESGVRCTEGMAAKAVQPRKQREDP